ncbi:uncharacterized protein LOC133907207 [Phragmites australis]|uniref:uncharacterized protein LOC133907207 n=1 Tax=Phragmites australis TaxID=29695 RepID=UPI002D790176|nr:uncharacterized protein LOC133907207 [Phragmites australis]
MDANQLVLQLEEVVSRIQKLSIQSAELLDRQDVGYLEGDDVDSSMDPNDVVPYDYIEGDDVGHIEGDDCASAGFGEEELARFPVDDITESKYERTWSPDDEVAILDALRPRRGRRQDALPHGVDLVMAVLDLETKIHALRRRFEENDAALCAGSGGPAPGHDLRLYTLSLDVWGAAVTPTAAPKPAAPAPAPAPAMKKKPAPPAYRGRVTAPAPRRRRYEEMRQQCPNLAGLLEELMKKAMEGVSDIAAWSMELRMKNQQLVGGVAVARADDRVKDLTSLIKRLV